MIDSYSKTPPPLKPINRRLMLNAGVAHLPVLVAEETAFFEKKTLEMKKLRQRQTTINRVMASGQVGAVVDAMIAKEIEQENSQ